MKKKKFLERYFIIYIVVLNAAVPLRHMQNEYKYVKYLPLKIDFYLRSKNIFREFYLEFI